MKQSVKVKYHTDIDRLERIGGGKSDWYDLRCAKTTHLSKGESSLIPLGISVSIPKGYEALVVPRSSTFKNHGIIMTNSIGVIDESFCGDGDQWHFPAYATRDTVIEKNERICQFRIIKHQPELEFEEVESLGNRNRGGIGSTGRV